MSVNDLLKSFIRHKRIFSILIALSLLLCFFALKLTESYTAEIIIKYIGDSAANGFTENGLTVNPYEINSPIVVKNAIEALELQNVNAESVRRNIVVTPITPTAEQEKYSSWIEKFSDYSMNETEKESTVYYSVKYTSPVGKDYVKHMLSAVISQYRLFYVENYTYSYDITKLSGDAALQYDYYDTVDMLRNKISSNIEYLIKIAQNGDNYRSYRTGYSPLDLATEYKSINEQQLSVAERMVLQYGITKDADSLRSTLNNRITDAAYEKSLNDEKAETQKELMLVYSDKNKAYLWNEGNGGNTSENESNQVRQDVDRDMRYDESKSVYDQMVLDYVTYSANSVNLTVDSQLLTEALESFPNNEGGKVHHAEIERLLEDTCRSFNELYEITKSTVEDYNTYKSSQSIETVSGVVAHKTTSSVFYYLVSVVLAVMIGAILCILLELLGKKLRFIDHA